MSLYAWVGAVLWSATPGYAYDNGGRTGELLSRVEFQTSARPTVNRIALDWDAPRRAAFLERLERILAEIPLDLAALPPVRRIIVSDSRYVCSSELQLELLNKLDWKDEDFSLAYGLLCGDNASWNGETGEIELAGAFILELEGRSGPSSGRDGVSATVLHELFHGWQDNHRELLRSFYRLRYDRIGAIWDGILSAHFHDHARVVRRTLEAAKAGRLSYEDLDAVWEKNFQGQRKIEQALYRAYRYPSRYEADGRLETHPMENADEYSAALVELLWLDPNAAVQYSPEETRWIRHYVFQEGLRPALAPRIAAETSRKTIADAEALAQELR
ncbi:MAG: hypothetical protein HY925_07940 [Elusimicrobia bacterium]|nr:hypothetical protein [Elusimicrobiota bacterium]